MALTNDKQFQMRVSNEFLSTIDAWRRAQPDIPGRAEAIRRLVERGLQANTRPLPLPSAPAEDQSLLSKFREFVIATAATDLLEEADKEYAMLLAREVATLPDDKIEAAILGVVDVLIRQRQRERDKEAKLAARKK